MREKKYIRLLTYLPLPLLLLLLCILRAKDLDGIILVMRCLLLIFVYVASIMDIREKRVPNKLLLLMLGAWFVVIVPQFLLRYDVAITLLISGGIGFMVASVVFVLVYVVSRGGLGGGDVKLMAVSGLYLGYNGVLPAMLYGSVLAAVAAGLLILFKKMGRKDSFPLVPFLFVGMALTVFFQ